MNKRIRLLADEAAKFSAVMTLPTGESGDDLFVEKFAELIIRECVDIAQHHVMNISTYADAEFVEEQIQKHFGVTE